jgi:hypothetical protein
MDRGWSGAAATSTPCSPSAATCCAALLAHAGRHAALQPLATPWPSGPRPRWPSPSATSWPRTAFGARFRDWYFLPMIGCIWSCPTDQMLRFPIATMIRFCHNHGLIQVTDRPQWHTVRGGSRTTSQDAGAFRMHAWHASARCALPPGSGSAGVLVAPTRQRALRRRGAGLPQRPEPGAAGRRQRRRARVLGAIRYHPNRAVLHTDTRVLPQRRAPGRPGTTRAAHAARAGRRVPALPDQPPAAAALAAAGGGVAEPDPVREPDPATVIGESTTTTRCSTRPPSPRKRAAADPGPVRHVWFAGAWTRYGFHEDGLMSGWVVQGLRARAAGTPAGLQPRRCMT